MKTKVCTKCHKRKLISNFNKKNQYKDGYNNWCKECVKEYNKQYRETHKQKVKKQHKKYYENNKESLKNQHKKYYQDHKQEIKKYLKKYRETYKKEIQRYNKQYNQIHKKKINKYRRERRKKIINCKLAHNIGNRINKALKNNSKYLPTMSLVGCDFEFLAYYLQCQFKKGMSWDNYGRGWNGKGKQEWHIDHIKPVVSFDLSKKSEQLKCFHYTNLQPLWAEENLKKGKG